MSLTLISLQGAKTKEVQHTAEIRYVWTAHSVFPHYVEFRLFGSLLRIDTSHSQPRDKFNFTDLEQNVITDF